MYARPMRDRFPNNLRVPDNYSGNAFREPPYPESGFTEDETDSSESISPPNNAPDFTESELKKASPDEARPVGNEYVKETHVLPPHPPVGRKKQFPLAGFGFDIGRIFQHGIGFEEILIIGLILLIAQSDEKDDILILLALLLFIN